jgi:hypothetical protein
MGTRGRAFRRLPSPEPPNVRDPTKGPMTADHQPHVPVDSSPLWLRAVQAAFIGVAVGLALHAILAVAGVQALGSAPAHSGPAECRKASPARDAVAPPASGPAISSILVLPRAL